MKPTLYFVESRGHRDPVEIRDVAEGVRISGGPEGLVPHPEMAGVIGTRVVKDRWFSGFWLIRAFTQSEALESLHELESGTHSDQHHIEALHALIRAGLHPAEI